MMVDRIEVLRGASALLYGGSAIGGVVNVIDRSIPIPRMANREPPCSPVTAASMRVGIMERRLSAVPANSIFKMNGSKETYEDYDAPSFTN